MVSNWSGTVLRAGPMRPVQGQFLGQQDEEVARRRGVATSTAPMAEMA